MKNGDVYFLLSSLAVFGLDYGIKQTGRTLQAVVMRFGEVIESSIAGGYQSGRYGYSGQGIDKAEVVGAIRRNGCSVGAAFINDAGSKAEIKHSMHHIGS